MSGSSHNGPGRNAATLLALMGLMAMAAGLLLLAALVMPQILGIVLVAGGMFLVCAFHYVVWGRWLSAALAEDDDEI